MRLSAKVLTATLPVLLALSLSAPAATVADCTVSAGCSCIESPLNAEELSLLYDIPTPEGAAEMTFVVQDGKAVWSQLSLSDIDITAGGDGQCAGPLAPEDGVWTSTATIDSMTCGSGTAMMKSIMTANMKREKPVRIAWGGVFDAETWRKAWLAANPDPEAGRPEWTRVSEIEMTGSERYEGLTSRYRMILLTPRSFRSEWSVEGRNEEGVCNWSITAMARKTSD